jgi:hypothetical protein
VIPSASFSSVVWAFWSTKSLTDRTSVMVLLGGWAWSLHLSLLSISSGFFYVSWNKCSISFFCAYVVFPTHLWKLSPWCVFVNFARNQLAKTLICEIYMHKYNQKVMILSRKDYLLCYMVNLKKRTIRTKCTFL